MSTLEKTILIPIIFITIVFIIGMYHLFIGYRINKVRDFLICVNDLCYEWSFRHRDQEPNAYIWFHKKNVKSFKYYLYSFKPLELKYWFNKEDIEKLMS